MSKSLYSKRHKWLADAIAEQRRVAGLTQAQVAERVSDRRYQSFIAKIESGDRRLDIVELLKLADIINLDVHALIDQLKAIPDE